jgi:hypothetical protein
MGSAWRWERLRRLTVASGLELRLVQDGKEVGGFMAGVYGLTPAQTVCNWFFAYCFFFIVVNNRFIGRRPSSIP